MSDQDKFKDFLPEGFGDLPPRAKMFGELDKLHKQYTEQAIADIRAQLSPEASEDLDRVISEGDFPDPLFSQPYSPKRTPISLAGADQIRFSGLFEHAREGNDPKYIVVQADLYKEDEDYSPFKGEPPLLAGMIAIGVSPDLEEPPFMVSGSDSRGAVLADYKELKRRSDQGIHYLTDDECVAVINTMARQEPDIEQMMKVTPGLSR